MNKQILTMIFGIVLMIGLVSSVAASGIEITSNDSNHIILYPGESVKQEIKVCNEFNYDKEIDLTYETAEGIEIIFSDDNFELEEDECKKIIMNIIVKQNSPSKNFVINILTKVTATEDEDSNGWFYNKCEWTCGEWRGCIDGQQTRACQKTSSYCSNLKDAPENKRACEMVIDIDTGEKITIPIEMNATAKNDTNTNDINDEEDKEPPKFGKILTWLLAILGIIVLIYLIYKLVNSDGEKDAKEYAEKGNGNDDDDDDSDDGENYEPIAGLDFNEDNPILPTSTAQELIGNKK